MGCRLRSGSVSETVDSGRDPDRPSHDCSCLDEATTGDPLTTQGLCYDGLLWHLAHLTLTRRQRASVALRSTVVHSTYSPQAPPTAIAPELLLHASLADLVMSLPFLIPAGPKSKRTYRWWTGKRPSP